MTPRQRQLLEALERAGRRGLTTAEIMQPDVGGERFSARLAELRAAGYKIDGKYERQGSWRYKLVASPPLDKPVAVIKPPVAITDEVRFNGLCWFCLFGARHTEHLMGSLVIPADPETAAELAEAA